MIMKYLNITYDKTMLISFQINITEKCVISCTIVILNCITRMSYCIRILFWINHEISHTLGLIKINRPLCRNASLINSYSNLIDTITCKFTISKSKTITSFNQISIYSLTISCRIVYTDITILCRTITCTIRCQNLCFYSKSSRNIERKSSITIINKTEIFLIIIDVVTILCKEVTNQIIVTISNTLLLCNNFHLTILFYRKIIDKTSLQSQGIFSFCCEGNIQCGSSFRNSLSSSQTIFCTINSKSNCSILRSIATQIKSVLSVRICYLRKTIE